MLNAQEGNLVPNPSFEEYLTCPQSTGELQIQVIDWFSWQESPDFFHVCNNDGLGTAGVPDNAWGSQPPVQGNAYAGFFTYHDTFEDAREYPAAELTQPLDIGQNYYVMFYTSPYDGGVFLDQHCFSNNIGLRFFKDPVYQTTPPSTILAPDNFAHFNTIEIIDSTEDWTLIEGWFTADDDYNWVCLGNFYDDSNTATIEANDNGYCYGIYYIDNVCVATDPEECEYLLNVEDKPDLSGIYLYPNPASNTLRFAGYSGHLDLEIFSTEGRLVFSEKQLSQNSTVNIELLSTGAYIAILSNDHFHSEHILIKR